MSDNYWDAVMIQPKSDIYFLGFGMMNQYEKKPFKVIFKWNIEGRDSEEFEVNLFQENLGADKFFEIDFQKLNFPTPQVKAEEKLHIMAKIKMDGPMRFNYGYSGSNYQTIEGQECEFTVNSSEYN